MVRNIVWFIGGLSIVLASPWISFFHFVGLEVLGPILGIVLIACSLFGDLPIWISWTQKLGEKLFIGIALGTFLLLLPLLFPTATHESSFLAFSPAVWAAYISIVLVGISFETSTLPMKIYRFCKHSRFKPFILIPLYVVIAGLLGNILDGVSIVIISTVILMHLLSEKWIIRSIFALLFGGLISNLITVAAEPTNIKFQDVLAPLLDKVHPSFWITNWPICILGIALPAIVLTLWMKKDQVNWKAEETEKITIFHRSFKDPLYIDTILAFIAVQLLALGIILHAIFENIQGFPNIPLWILIFPAGFAAINHLFVGERLNETWEHMQEQAPVWLKLIVIFSLLWFLQNGLTNTTNVLYVFVFLPSSVQYGFLILLSLASTFADNVAIAAMQATIILHHPIAIWEIRLLLLLLSLCGGLTPFACLQSLSINHRLKLSTKQWVRETPLWAGLALIGGITGLILISLLYPTTVGLP